MEASRLEALSNFQGITGTDPSTALFYLESSRWNLDLAVRNFYDNPTGNTSNKSSKPNVGQPKKQAESPSPLKRISDINLQVDEIRTKIDALKNKFENGAGVAEYLSTDVQKRPDLIKRWKRECLFHNEELMRRLEALDAIQGDDKVRSERKKTVLKIQSIIKILDILKDSTINLSLIHI
eukprot:TRINITY_DN1940_c0_g1_i3.p1 TRINITY_DN1940_c0_g1~~TRINITY_DN1940_c0_g1_i3.p1  ORF type:complete len:180 (-),score=24.83 TRINITY_DN1940_c0_g1_i3:39-578(-)